MSSDIVIFPKYITIQAINHTENYASRNGPTDIRFSKNNIDRYCYFEIIEQIEKTNKLKFKLDNGNFVYTHGNEYVHSSGDYNVVKNNDIFEFIRLENKGSNIFAIKSSNGKFVTIYDISGEHKLKATKTSIDKYCEFKIEEPIIKKEIINVKYDLNKAVINQTSPEIAGRQTVNNNSNNDATSKIGYRYMKSETGTWNNSFGIEITRSMEFGAGVPFIADTKFSIQISTSYTHEWGGSKTIEKEIYGDLSVIIPPRKKGTVSVVVSKALLDVPFTYTTKTTYLSGETIIKNDVNGIYKNLESYLIDGDVSKLEDI